MEREGMNQTDILLTLYSIVAGLGISKLMQGLATMIEARGRIRFYWIHSAWLFIVMAAHIVTIFALIRFSKGAHWTVFNSMLTLCIPLLLYLVSDLIVPTFGADEQIDLREYFFRNRRWFYSLMIAVAVVGAAVQIAVEHTTDWTQGGALRVIAVLALAGGLVSERPAVQSTVVLVLLTLVLAGAALVSVELM
jgi:hypothetical protein